MHRILAGLIAVVLAAAVGVAIVRSTEETAPSASGSPTPKQTYTYNGPPPTVPQETETPIVPPSAEPTTSPTETTGGLANTGSSSTASIALVMLSLALGAGAFVKRAARSSR